MSRPTLLRRLLDAITPRVCPSCGRRLATSEDVICATCYLRLPRTMHWLQPQDNPMAKLFYGLADIERAAALFYYYPQSLSSGLIHQLKYGGRPDIAATLAQMGAAEMALAHFFDGITAIVPVPLARKRLRQRGYNQCMAMAHGVAKATGMDICHKALRRTTYEVSQTTLSHNDRMDNVANAFCLGNALELEHQHVLLVDDVITTGATMMACANTMSAIPGIKISLMALCFTDR